MASVSRPYRLDSERTRQSGHRHFVERKRARTFADEQTAITAARAELDAGWCPTVWYRASPEPKIVFDWIEEL